MLTRALDYVILFNCLVIAPQALDAFLTAGLQPPIKKISYHRQHGCSAEKSYMSVSRSISNADKLRKLLSQPEILVMPCCYDGLTAKLVENAGFPLTFMTGFGVSGAHGLPDTQVRRPKKFLSSFLHPFEVHC